jgi:D-alanyl-D-alanine carboxypeptidase
VLHTDPYHQWTRQELLNLSFAHDVKFQPGEKWEYSNTNTVLLGLIIEAKTGGKTVAQNFQERIYDRLGMRQTSWPLGSNFPTPHANGITDDTSDRTVVDATNWNASWADAAGQLVSNLSDMEIWARALGTGSLISPAMQAERLDWVHLPGNDGTYGLAIGKAGGFLHHQGELPGYNTIALYLPPYDGTIVVLANANVPWDEPGPAARIFKAVSDVVSPQYSPGNPQDDE